MHLPLQQGLRLLFLRPELFFYHCASASSITTRIKTSYIYEVIILFWAVRVHLPLQQGLRLAKDCCQLYFPDLVRVHLPLQQGLRQIDYR